MRISGFKLGQIEFTVENGKNLTLGEVLRQNKIEFRGNTVVVDGEVIATDAVSSHPITPATKQVEVAPAAKGGSRFVITVRS